MCLPHCAAVPEADTSTETEQQTAPETEQAPPEATGQPAVLNDEIISVREKQSLFFDGTDWKVGEAATVQDLGSGNKCPPPEPLG